MSKKKKAILIFSGGLDSILAVKLLEEQNIDVLALCFESNFYNAKEAKKSAKANNINLKIIDIKKDFLRIVKNPPSGYGKNMNPCIDCHSLMLKKAKKFLEKNNDYDFIASGEVLGQRPFSQNKEALQKVVKLSETEVLRPLSAKLLPETKIEKQGIVNRNKLESIQGRNRTKQKELAKKFNLKYFPSPAGGCLLTDIVFSQRLKELLEKNNKANIDDIELLKYGRIFWVSFDKKILIVIGRNKDDNIALEKLGKKGDFMVKLKTEKGPSVLIRSFTKFDLSENENLEFKIPFFLEKNKLFKKEKHFLKDLCLLAGWYAVKQRNKKTKFILIKK